MTLQGLVIKALSLPVRVDVKARLLGYAIIVHYVGFRGLGVSDVTISRIRAELRSYGMIVDKIDD